MILAKKKSGGKSALFFIIGGRVKNINGVITAKDDTVAVRDLVATTTKRRHFSKKIMESSFPKSQ